jgi:hypothetical protein
MNGTNRFERMLRWYPSDWRSKYGEGMVALLEDTYGTGKIPLRTRLSVVRAGSIERARASGLIGSAASSLERQRTGSLLVLCGWAGFMLAGALFAKFTDNWGASSSNGDRALVKVIYGTVQWVGAAGLLLVLVAALMVLPSLNRLARSGAWASLRRPVLRAAGAGAVIVASTAGMVLWAHHLSYRDRNGALVPYETVVACWSVAVAVAVATGTSAAISITRRLDLSYRKVRSLSSFAVALTLFMAVILGAMIAWWRIEALHAPAFMRNGIGNGFFFTSSAYPPALLVASFIMLLGLAAAITGTFRVVQARRDGGRPVGATDPLIT